MSELYQIQDLVPGVRALISPNSSGFSSIFIIGPNDNAMLVDTLSANCATTAIASLEAGGIAPTAVKGIIITHGHGDHTGGLAAFKQWCGAPAYGMLWTALQCEDPLGYFHSPLSWMDNTTPLGQRAFFAVGGESARIEHILREGDRLEHAGFNFEVLHTPGHDRGELTLYERRQGLMFVGDLIQGGLDATTTWLGLFTDFVGQRQSLERVLALRPQWLFKGHRMARYGEDALRDIKSAIARINAIEGAILGRLAEGAVNNADDITRSVLAKLLTPPSSNMLRNYARVSVEAALSALALAGKIKVNEGGANRYELIANC